VLAAGYRGAAFITGILARGLRPKRIVSYQQADDQSRAFERLRELARSEGISFEEARYPTLGAEELAFLAGWQFLIKEGVERCIVFHDSLLPKYRGFAPTVTALLCGDEEIGVTAFKPDAGIDTEPVYAQRTGRVLANTSVQGAADLQTSAMVDLALELAQRAERGELRAVAQGESPASFSLWRDASDYFVDWRQDATQILRQIASVGFPYEGAKAVLTDHVLTIVKARGGPDLPLLLRDPGKVWQVENGRALVVCGTGTIWIDEVVDAQQKPFEFKTLRTRFLTADTAWLVPFLRAPGTPNSK